MNNNKRYFVPIMNKITAVMLCILFIILLLCPITVTAAETKQKFEEFAQEDNGARTQYKGTGLGLAITKKYVELMGGTITVDTAKGIGSTFTVEIPLELTEGGGRKTSGGSFCEQPGGYL